MSTTDDTAPALAGAEEEVYSAPTKQMYIERPTTPVRVEVLQYNGFNQADVEKYIGTEFKGWEHDLDNSRTYTKLWEENLEGREYLVYLNPGDYLVKYHEDMTPQILTQEELDREWMLDAGESNFVRHARHELEIIGEDQETIDGVIKVMQAFADMGHSGGSHGIISPMIAKLLNFENLTPLTNNPAEWDHVSEEQWGRPGGIWQNRRRSEAFSNDGGKTYYLLSESSSDGHREPLHTAVDYTIPFTDMQVTI